MTSPGAPRSAARPEIKTIASVGDRPLPPVTGEPGSSVVADSMPAEPRRSPNTRVSGRVVDEKGRPVANAIVRPADGGSTGGRVAETTTDKAGGFTLHGLRAGSRYTLIAEYDTPSGLKTGRVEARSADTNLEIALGNEDLQNDLGAGEGSRARSVSNREDLDIPTVDEPRPSRSNRSSQINLDDIPTSEEIEAQDDAQRLENQPKPRSFPTKAKAPARGWKGRDDLDVAPARNDSASTIDSDPGSTDGSAKRVSQRSDLNDPPPAPAADQPEEEGDNPLPPAIDPTEKPTAKKSASVTGPRPSAAPAVSATDELRASVTSGGMKLAGPEPEAGRKVRWDDAIAAAPLAVAASQPVAAPQPVVAHQPVAAPAPEAAPQPTLADQKKTTWEEMLATLPPPDGANPTPASRAGAAAPNPGPAIARSPSNALPVGPTPPPGGFLRGTPPKIPAPTEFCRYDARIQKINDLRLPDLEGRLVSFQEIEADYVLLDFWGSWCQPCVRSVPHLIDVQKKYGPRLKVVGIACEKGTFEQRSVKAQTAAEKLGINYPILVSSAEDFSPVQNALKVQSFPTLILIDRRGQVVWREQGASTVTMDRLDRILASSARGETVRR